MNNLDIISKKSALALRLRAYLIYPKENHGHKIGCAGRRGDCRGGLAIDMLLIDAYKVALAWFCVWLIRNTNRNIRLCS